MFERIKRFTPASLAAIVLLICAVILASILLKSFSLVWTIELLCMVFLAINLFKQTRTWIHAIPLAVLAVCALFLGGSTLGTVGNLLSHGFLAVFAVAVFTDRLPAMRPLAAKGWFVPALIKLVFYLLPALSAGGLAAAGTRVLLFNLLQALAMLMLGRWFADFAIASNK